tara:strand:+ start:277 stop:483 length:207 start_codon:yes stop_codon:yes gene_type:complete
MRTYTTEYFWNEYWFLKHFATDNFDYVEYSSYKNEDGLPIGQIGIMEKSGLITTKEALKLCQDFYTRN